VLLIDEQNNKIGVVPTIEALRRAHEASLDLVEVSSESTPPVCRILDFGKYKYEQAKKEKASKAKTKLAEMKEVRLGRSMKIDPHDVSIRIDQARRFLMEGHKVQIVQNFRGRELQHKRLGDARLREIVARLADISRVEMTPRLNGRRMSMILAPDKAKIDALARKSAKSATAPAPPASAAPMDTAATSPDIATIPPTPAATAKPAKPRKSVGAAKAGKTAPVTSTTPTGAPA
jgi:translation initiation factor IF-3